MHAWPVVSCCTVLDERKAAILRAVVQEYIETAQPVGSAHVARAAGVAVSSATIRNEMAVLERDGFLVQPHTSAGRIPTDLGYRFFVDDLKPNATLDRAQRLQVRDFFSAAHTELERMLHDTTQLLTGLTSYASVVVGPPHEVATVRTLQLVGLAPRLALVVAVLSNGVVEKCSLELADDTPDTTLSAVGAYLSSHVVGRTLLDLAPDRSLPLTSGDQGTDALARLAVEALGRARADEGDEVYVGGASKMASAFDAVETVRAVLGALEQQYVVVSLLKDVLDRGLSVAIGAEHGIGPLAECSIVVAPFGHGGERAGTIAVLGPTRMNYPQAMAAVAVVSERLGQRLSDG